MDKSPLDSGLVGRGGGGWGGVVYRNPGMANCFWEVGSLSYLIFIHSEKSGSYLQHNNLSCRYVIK